MNNIKDIINSLNDSLENLHIAFIDSVGDVYAVSEETIKNIISLLEEYNAVEPINSYGTFRCGNCRNIVGYNDGHGRGYQNNFCSKCGKAVKWK